MTSFDFDAFDRQNQIDSPEGILNYEFDAQGRINRTTVGDPLDPTHDFTSSYDSIGRLATVSTIERNDVTLPTPEVTAYSYDAVGNLSRVDQTNGAISVYTYDDLNRLDVLTHYAADPDPEILSDNPKISEFDYTVQADGRRTAVTETRWEAGSPLVTSVAWTYDNLGRLTKEIYDSHDDLLDYTHDFTFDLVGNRLTKTVDQGSDATVDETFAYSYDDNDRLITETKVVGQVDDGING